MSYVLHYAPDNASLIIRIALEDLGVSYRAQLVDRREKEQRSEGYRRLNPNGLIPVLETPSGPIFETAAIGLWLAETHGALAPAPGTANRAAFLKWLFFVSNTLHADLRLLFYPAQYIGSSATDQLALRKGMAQVLPRRFALLNDLAETAPDFLGAATPTILDFYVAACARWAQIYPVSGTAWFDWKNHPALYEVAKRVETRASARSVADAEGLGAQPFTAAHTPNPPEGSAL
ncbi:MAG: glutathione S-transferase family protein [Pseudomonadota bacterium]